MAFTPEHMCVWFEIPVRDMDAASAFYTQVLGVSITRDDTSGPNPMAMLPTRTGDGIGGHLYPGQPATGGQGPTIHLAVPDTVEAAAARCREAGGQVLYGPITIPAGRFLYCIDPDGNSIGLFEAKAA